MKYQIELTPEQAHVVIKSLDFYSRILCNQLRELSTILRHKRINFADLEHQLDKTTRELGGETGIMGPKVNHSAQIAYDIQQVLRQLIAKEEKQPSYSVWHDDPLKSAKIPLPTARVIKDAPR